MGDVHVVVGGQFGSEGKGHVTAWLTRELGAHNVIRVAGPNAGHSAFDRNGQKWALRQVPIAAVVDENVKLYIAAGSEVDPNVLWDEIRQLQLAGIPVTNRLHIDEAATLIEPYHLDEEKNAGLTAKIGSTGKGIGAARSARVMREAVTWGQFVNDMDDDDPRADTFRSVSFMDTATLLFNYIDRTNEVTIIEGTQGWGLGVHTAFYPKTTSSDARAIDFLAMAGISPWQESVDVHVWPVFRTFPIRVAGDSGPLYHETTWKLLGEQSNGHIKPELTTVTQKERRVGDWDDAVAVQAMRANGGPSSHMHPVLTFLDYVFPEVADHLTADEFGVDVWNYLAKRSTVLRNPFFAVGTGPDSIVRLG